MKNYIELSALIVPELNKCTVVSMDYDFDISNRNKELAVKLFEDQLISTALNDLYSGSMPLSSLQLSPILPLQHGDNVEITNTLLVFEFEKTKYYLDIEYYEKA